jgi:hypothetical protein
MGTIRYPLGYVGDEVSLVKSLKISRTLSVGGIVFSGWHGRDTGRMLSLKA